MSSTMSVEMPPIGGQSQLFNGLTDFLARYRPGIWKLIDPDNGVIMACAAASPDTRLVVRMFTGQESYKDAAQHPDARAYGRDYVRAIYARWKDVRHLVYAFELENEQTIFNLAHVARWNEFTIGAVLEANALGIRVVVGNFPEGHPEVYVPGSDYVLAPGLWQAMAPALRAVKAGGHLLAFHEYDCPIMQRGWSPVYGRGYRCGRHHAVLAALPADLRDIKLLITENGIDWLIVGVIGGYAHNGGTIEAFVSQLAWYQSICAPNVVGVLVFGAGLYGGAAVDALNVNSVLTSKVVSYMKRYGPMVGVQAINWTEYDCFRDDHDKEAFGELVQAGAPPTDPPPTGGTMEPNPGQTVAEVPFLIKASLQAKWGPGGLGQPVYGEYGATGDGNEKWRAWIFLRGGLKVKEGNYADFSGVKLFSPTTGESLAEPLPWPSGTPTPGPGATLRRLTTADFAEAGWPFQVAPCVPVAGQRFFGLIAFSDFKSGERVGTETKCLVTDANGALLTGYKITHAYDEANKKSETFPAPTGFVLGPGSYFNDTPKDRFYVAIAGTLDGAIPGWPSGYPSDTFLGGMPNGQHFEGRLTWALMTG